MVFILKKIYMYLYYMTKPFSYKYIYNPKTGRKVLANGKIGRKIIKIFMRKILQKGGGWAAAIQHVLRIWRPFTSCREIDRTWRPYTRKRKRKRLANLPPRHNVMERYGFRKVGMSRSKFLSSRK